MKYSVLFRAETGGFNEIFCLFLASGTQNGNTTSIGGFDGRGIGWEQWDYCRTAARYGGYMDVVVLPGG